MKIVSMIFYSICFVINIVIVLLLSDITNINNTFFMFNKNTWFNMLYFAYMIYYTIRFYNNHPNEILVFRDHLFQVLFVLNGAGFTYNLYNYYFFEIPNDKLPAIVHVIYIFNMLNIILLTIDSYFIKSKAIYYDTKFVAKISFAVLLLIYLPISMIIDRKLSFNFNLFSKLIVLLLCYFAGIGVYCLLIKIRIFKNFFNFKPVKEEESTIEFSYTATP